MSTLTEHECFARLTNHLSAASAEAKMMAALRDDDRWQKVAQLLAEVRDKTYDLATKGTRQ